MYERLFNLDLTYFLFLRKVQSHQMLAAAPAHKALNTLNYDNFWYRSCVLIHQESILLY